MRIFVIHNFYQHAGGEDSVFHQEVKELSELHEVSVYTSKNRTGIKGLTQFLFYPFNMGEGSRIKRAIQHFKPDVVHIHNLHYALGPWPIRIISSLGLPMVMTLHNFRLLCPSASLFVQGRIFTESLQEAFPWTAVKLGALDGSKIKTFLTGFTYWLHRKLGTWHKVSSFIVLSAFAKQLFASSTFPVSPQKFVIRPNSIALQPVKTEKSGRMLYIGRLSAEKGILPLLEALSDTDIALDIYGTGPQLGRVMELVDSNSNLRYMGYQPQEVLTKAIAQADALVVPSVCYEGMPMTIIEAFAQGTPALVSALGILKEMVLPLHTGMHFDPFDKSDIQRTLKDWKDLAVEKKNEIALHCKTEFQKNYTLQENMQQLLNIYAEAIKHNEK